MLYTKLMLCALVLVIAEGTDNPCDTNICNNGGTCIHLYDDNVVCICATGYRGVTCDDEEFIFSGNSNDPCDPDPCENGYCKRLNKNTIQCVCDAGYSGRFCDVNPCDTNICNNGGTCIHLYDDIVVCTCATGYRGVTCDDKEFIFSGNSNDPCDPDPCENGNCKRLDKNTIQCVCDAGYSGRFCDVNPCEVDPCKHGGTCYTNGIGYYCACTDLSYGINCEAVIGCPDDTLLFGDCEKSCTSIGCSTGQICCSNGCGTECMQLVIDTDHACTDNLCQNGATCEIVDNLHYQCKCQSGYTGTFCEQWLSKPKPCESSPCYHGTCYDVGDHYYCVCDTGYSGSTCYHKNHPCSSPNPCVNGFCGATSEGYKCYCMLGYTGEHCDVSTDICDTDPCYNQEDISCPCDPNPCQHGGTCTEIGPVTFKCHCRQRWTGDRCEDFKCPDFTCSASEYYSGCHMKGCDIESCPNYPNAHCCNNYCDGCKAVFYTVGRGRKIPYSQCGSGGSGGGGN